MSRVYLVGFMGCGKTTVGRLLAERTGDPFVDLDATIEGLTGKTIRDTFERHGEAWFRAREMELLRGTADLPRAVVALGGGTFTFPQNAAFVRLHGISVFLDAPFELIAERLSGKADRPLFRSLEQARSLYEARYPSYRMADRTIPVRAEDDVEAVVDRIVKALARGPEGR
jgi:shikimate kinase